MKTIITLTLFLITSLMHSQTVLGKWVTVDDETGQRKSIVEVYEKDGEVYGKIHEILLEGAPSICEKCKGVEKNTPIIGLNVLKGLHKSGRYYKGGTAFDPERGKEFTCKIWLDEEDANILYVRGYIGFLYRTQTWIRHK